MVTAHEAAHQWWGNLLVPGKEPGGNILSEGMAHFSVVLLFEQVKGPRERIEFLKRIETSYARARQVDAEKPLVETDGSRAGDTTVTYDKGGWVFWMLLNRMGRERTLARLKDFILRYHHQPDHPVLQDFVAVMREHAADVASYDEFTRQWFFAVVAPEYALSDAKKEPGTAAGTWRTRVTVTNRGTGTMPIEIAAGRGTRFPDVATSAAAEAAADAWREARVTVTLAAGESREVTIASDFEPEHVVVDPDALVLQLRRERATSRLK